MKKLVISLVLLSLLLGCNCRKNSVAAEKIPAEIQQLAPAILSALPSGKTVALQQPGRLQIQDQAGKIVGQVRYTWPLNQGAEGFNGPVPVVVVLDAAEQVITVLFPANAETPDFMKKLTDEAFGDSWSGFSRTQAATMDIDGVSGATYSSTAAMKSVQALLKDK